MLNELLKGDYIDLYLIPWGIKIVTAILIFVIGRWFARFLIKLSTRLMLKGKLDPMLVEFLNNILYALLLVVVVLAALDQLGVKTTSALAVLGAAGLAVGLSLQNSLANFAAGVMLIIFRPFKTGDFVEAGGVSGIVETITVFTTIMRTGDNREVIVPNGQIYSGTITNYSARDTRRIDMTFSIGYDDDIKLAKSLIETTLKQEARLLEEPAPTILVMELGASSVDLAVRPWVKSSDYWAVRSDLLENIKAAFDANGVSIPYPQQDVHIKDMPLAAVK
ncbi:MAG: mechanosensitive ion channel [Gammaproteobacteria bacterium]|nr:mechanosensitive ion channel [Gammaproteobacteria bacterium]